MGFLFSTLVIASLLQGLLPYSLNAQTADLEVNHIEFTGNTFFDRGLLLQTIRAKESPGGFSQFLNSISGDRLGGKPEYFHPDDLVGDEQSIQILYRDHGYFHTIVTAVPVVDSVRKQVNITFAIQENKRSMIDSIVVRGLEAIPSDLKKQTLHEPLIQAGQPYEKAKAVDEIRRLLALLANNGFRSARFVADSSGEYEYLSSNNIVLVLAFATGRQYYFGDVNVRLDAPRDDLEPNIALRQLDFKPGEVYSEEKRASSERGLNRLGLYETARIEDAASWDSASARVPVDIVLRPKIRNELSPELIVSNENNELNLGLGLGFTNRNFLGDGRLFNANFRGRTQSLGKIIGGKSFRDPEVVAALNFQVLVTQPYLFDRTMSGFLSSDFGIDKQKPYILYIFRNKVGVNKQFATYTVGTFEWTLERVQPSFLEDTVSSSTIATILRQEDQQQFNSILTFTLSRDKTNDPFSPTEGFYHSISLEESGILPKLIQGNRFDPPYTQYYKVTLFGRWYDDLSSNRTDVLAIKLKTGYQDKYGESRSRDVSIPLNRRFFSGGSSSLRGWRARELGAMSDALLPFGGNFLLEGSLEMRVNHFKGLGKWWFIRFDNIWGVYFVDVGNTWSAITDFKARDVAMAAGIGFRYETFFGPFRIDYGLKMYDPKGVAGHQTVFKKQFLAETLKSGVLHFGIGHAF